MNRLDGLLFMSAPKPTLTEFSIDYRLKCCAYLRLHHRRSTRRHRTLPHRHNLPQTNTKIYFSSTSKYFFIDSHSTLSLPSSSRSSSSTSSSIDWSLSSSDHPSPVGSHKMSHNSNHTFKHFSQKCILNSSLSLTPNQ